MTTTRRAGRKFTLTMKGHATVWYLNQAEALAARPADATAQCACCDTVYPAKGLKPLDSDAVYEQASQVVSFERYAPICRFCAEDFNADFGEDTDVYSIFDRGIDPND